MDKQREKRISDEFQNLEEIFEKYFENIEKSKNIITTYNVTKKQAKQGMNQKFKISVSDICDTCKWRKKGYECKKCHNKGYVYKEKTFELKIPPKIRNNDIIVFEKQGNKFIVDEERGDLFVKIHIYGDKSKRKGKKYIGIN